MIGFFTILLIAISLSMDTFSLSIVYGTIGVNKKNIYILSCIVGFFHFIMPCMGNALGQLIIDKLPVNPSIVIGSIFMLLAIQMFFSRDKVSELGSFFSYLLFGLSVSLDSFSVGITISKITHYFILAYFLFAMVSFIFTFLGLKFGCFINKLFQKSAVFIGAGILCLLGFLYFFKAL